MDCREFEARLARYLEGSLEEPALSRMVEHEAECARCHARASEAMRDPEPAHVDPAFATEILRRTLGADCRQIERALALEIDGPLPPVEAERVRQHLRECAACRALAHALRLLPRAYRDLPRLHAGRSFTQAVIRRTSGQRTGFLSVLRAMWRSPAFVWEGAVICSLLFTPVLGHAVLGGGSRLEQQFLLARAGVQIAAAPAEAWSALRREGRETRQWVEGSVVILRAEARMHLEPIREHWDEWISRLGPDSDSKANEPSEGGQDELRQP